MTLGAALGAAAAACADPSGPGACTVVAEGGAVRAVAGVTREAPARVGCARDVPVTVRWQVADTTLAVVDATTGRLTGRAPGTTTLLVEVVGQPAATARLPLTVVAPLALDVAPALTLEPLAETALAVAVTPTADTPAGLSRAVTFASSDRCVVDVRPDGVLRAGAAGTARVTVALAAAPAVRRAVDVTVRGPAVLRLAVQGLADATTGAPVDPGALRGTVLVRVNVDAGVLPAGASLEATLAGRPVARVELPGTGAVDVRTVTLRLETAAREADGTPRFANGPQSLAIALVASAPGNPGCPPIDLGARVALPVVLANP